VLSPLVGAYLFLAPVGLPGLPFWNGRPRVFPASFRCTGFHEGSSDHHRTMEVPLQYEEAAQYIGLSPPGPRSYRPDGPRTGHALTFTLDHSMGASQLCLQQFPKPLKDNVHSGAVIFGFGNEIMCMGGPPNEL
jgi:hypothetical protein